MSRCSISRHFTEHHNNNKEQSLRPLKTTGPKKTKLAAQSLEQTRSRYYTGSFVVALAMKHLQ